MEWETLGKWFLVRKAARKIHDTMSIEKMISATHCSYYSRHIKGDSTVIRCMGICLYAVFTPISRHHKKNENAPRGATGPGSHP